MSRMRIGRAWAVGLAASLCLCLVAAPVKADTVLLAQTTLVVGSSSVTDSFTAPSAGTVTVQLTDVAWPQALSSLTFMASSPGHVVADWSTQSSSTESFEVGPGTYFAHITGNAGGLLDLGLYCLKVSFQPTAGPVPLPGSGWLLGFGLLGLLGARVLRDLRARNSPAADFAAAV